MLHVMRVDGYCKQYRYKVTLLLWALDTICYKDQYTTKSEMVIVDQFHTEVFQLSQALNEGE